MMAKKKFEIAFTYSDGYRATCPYCEETISLDDGGSPVNTPCGSNDEYCCPRCGKMMYLKEGDASCNGN